MARIELVERVRSPVAKAAFSYSRRAYGKVVAPLKAYAHNNRILWGTGQMELALKGASSVPMSLKYLGTLRIALRVGCPF